MVETTPEPSTADLLRDSTIGRTSELGRSTITSAFFSNAERLRIRLAQGDPVDGLDYPSNVACAPRPGLHSRSLRSRRGVSVASKPAARRRRPFQKPLLSGPVQKFRKSPRPLPTVCLETQAELEWFLALPPKIQQTHFSVEERSRLRQACWNTEILDPADEALYRFHQPQKTLSSEALSLEGTTLPTSPSSIPYLDFSSDTSDDNDDVDDDDMDASFYDSFRWLDEDGELDLTLDEYRPHVSNSTSDLPSRQRPSFRRTLSLNSVGLSRRMSSSVAPRKVPNSSQSSNVPSALMHAGRGSTTRPPSRQKQSYHAPGSSTSSIDPSAQYYQDPEARLKLRVYLASPQKFDEAIEFGFPSLGDKGTRSPQRAPADFQTKCHDFIGTFLEDDDDASVTSDNDESHPDRSRFSYTTSDTPSSHDLPFRTNKRQTWVPTSQSAPYRHPKNREMTLKMTLTRPDLRTDSGTPSPPAIDPLKPRELSSASGGMETWDTDKTDHSLMKKVWRRIRGQGS